MADIKEKLKKLFSNKNKESDCCNMEFVSKEEQTDKNTEDNSQNNKEDKTDNGCCG